MVSEWKTELCLSYGGDGSATAVALFFAMAPMDGILIGVWAGVCGASRRMNAALFRTRDDLEPWVP